MADDELTRRTSKAIVVVTTPDVCKAPTVPTPFVSYSKFDLSTQTADSVRMTSCVSFTKDSRLSMTMADQGGVGGGVKSQVFGGMCRPFKGWSSTVRAQGSEICRHDVVMEVNCAGPEGPGNTFGKVFYVESLTCASVSESGDIVVDEPKGEVSNTNEPNEDRPENSSDMETSDDDMVDDDERQDSASNEGGFRQEAGKRVQNEIDGIKQSCHDIYDLASSPEARQQAMGAAKDTFDSAIKDPVGFGTEAGKAVIDDIKEPFDTAGSQVSKGDFGGAIASAGFGILNVFNPLKKAKILQKVGKLGKILTKKGRRLPSKNRRQKHRRKKSDSESRKKGNDGGTVKKRSVVISDKQVQKKFKHAKDFGVDGPYNKSNAEKFKGAINEHVSSPQTQPISGTYRGEAAIIHTNPQSGLAVITKPDGTFVSGWKLSNQQLESVMRTGNLGGG